MKLSELNTFPLLISQLKQLKCRVNRLNKYWQKTEYKNIYHKKNRILFNIYSLQIRSLENKMKEDYPAEYNRYSYFKNNYFETKMEIANGKFDAWLKTRVA